MREQRPGRSPRAHGAVPVRTGPGTRRHLARRRDAHRRNRCRARRRSRTDRGSLEAGMAAGGAPDTRPRCAPGDERAPVSCRSGAPGREATRPGSRSPPRGVPRAVRAGARARPAGFRARGDDPSRGAHAEGACGRDDPALWKGRAGAGARLAQAHPGALGMSRAVRRRDKLSSEHAHGRRHVPAVRAGGAGSRAAVHRRGVPAGRVVPGVGVPPSAPRCSCSCRSPARHATGESSPFAPRSRPWWIHPPASE